MADRHMVEVEGELADETDATYKFVVDGGDASQAVWVPKSLSGWEYGPDKVAGVLTVARWFAEREGLV